MTNCCRNAKDGEINFNFLHNCCDCKLINKNSKKKIKKYIFFIKKSPKRKFMFINSIQVYN